VASALGLLVALGELTPGDLAAADEVFLTSSIREVLPVVSIDGQRIGAGAPGPVTRAIHAGFRERVGLGDRPMPWETAR
jgi:branched-chain amino acid aminotransferase